MKPAEIDFEPDCFDLNDWILLCHPPLYESTKYLSPNVQYQLHLDYWKQLGKPDVEMEMQRAEK